MMHDVFKKSRGVIAACGSETALELKTILAVYCHDRFHCMSIIAMTDFRMHVILGLFFQNMNTYIWGWSNAGAWGGAWVHAWTYEIVAFCWSKFACKPASTMQVMKAQLRPTLLEACVQTGMILFWFPVSYSFFMLHRAWDGDFFNASINIFFFAVFQTDGCQANSA